MRELRQRLRKLAAEHRRFEYRRLHLLLVREGEVVNCKKTDRAYAGWSQACAVNVHSLTDAGGASGGAL